MTRDKDSEIFPDIRVHPVQEPVTSQPETHLEETEQPETQGENKTKYDWSTEGTGPIVDLFDIPPFVTRLHVDGQQGMSCMSCYKSCNGLAPAYLFWHVCYATACLCLCTGIPVCYYKGGSLVGEFFKDKNECCKDSYTNRR